MPYTPYTPTWNNPYLPQYNQGQPVTPMVQPYQQPVNGTTQVSGPESAMQYGRRMPPNSTSPALFNTNGKPYEDVMKVVDEHLATIRLLYPKTYDGIIQRIKEL